LRSIFYLRFPTALILVLMLIVTLLPALPAVKGEATVHDLEVSLTAEKIVFRNDGKGHLSHGNSTMLNATVTNKGDFNESNVALQIIINGSTVQNSTTSRLEINGTFLSLYFWAPDDADYNVTVYAPPVDGEDNTTNNNVTRWVRVCQDQPPIVNFTYSPPPPSPGPIKDEIVTFDASNSSDPDWGTILNYTWNFGDGNTTTVPYFQITHKYTTWGNKTVTLTVYDTEGKSNSTSANVTIYARPVAEFTISGEHFVDHELTFNGTKSRDDDGMITSYFWDFGDGTNSTGNLTTHVYHANGTYWVNLSVIDNDGLIGFKSESITIGLGTPIADFEIIRPSPY